jgi:hypothetical protein
VSPPVRPTSRKTIQERETKTLFRALASSEYGHLDGTLTPKGFPQRLRVRKRRSGRVTITEWSLLPGAPALCASIAVVSAPIAEQIWHVVATGSSWREAVRELFTLGGLNFGVYFMIVGLFMLIPACLAPLVRRRLSISPAGDRVTIEAWCPLRSRSHTVDIETWLSHAWIDVRPVTIWIRHSRRPCSWSGYVATICCPTQSDEGLALVISVQKSEQRALADAELIRKWIPEMRIEHHRSGNLWCNSWSWTPWRMAR